MAAFDQIYAVDPNNSENVAENGVISIYAPGARTLLAIKTVTGEALSNPLQLNARGFGPAFIADGYTLVAWEAVAPGEVFQGTFKSYEGVLEQATLAKTEAAAGAAAELSQRIDTGEFNGADGSDGQDGSNVLPTDTAIKQAIESPGTQTAAALKTFVAPVQRLTDTGRGAVVLTIDDAFVHMRTMANMMNARGQRGTFCITPDLMGGGGKITDQDVKDFAAAGHEISAHSKTHANMTAVTDAVRAVEYDYPKSYLENLIGAGKVTTWAYPFGTGSGGRTAATDLPLYLRYDRLLDTGINTSTVVYPRYSRFPPYLINRTAWSADNHQQVMSMVRKAASSAVLVPIFFHNVDTPINPTSAQFLELLDTCQALNIPMITTSEAFPSARTLLNAGFESVSSDPGLPMSPWRRFQNGTGTQEIVEEQPAANLPGSRSLHLVTTDNGFSYVRQTVQVEPGVPYTLSFRARAVSGANLGTEKAYGRVRGLDYGQAFITGSEVKTASIVAANTTWAKYTADFTPGPTCRTVEVDLVLQGVIDGARVAFDHVWFEPKSLGDLG